MSIFLGGMYKEVDYRKSVAFIKGKDRDGYKSEFSNFKKKYGLRPVNAIFKNGINSYIHGRVIGNYSVASIDQLFKSMLSLK
jgi:hypothetical protein